MTLGIEIPSSELLAISGVGETLAERIQAVLRRHAPKAGAPFLALDIETRPGPRWDDAEWCEERKQKIEPDARLKDPAKIAANIDDKYKAMRNKAALDPKFGRVVCIGYQPLADEEAAPRSVVSLEDESSLIGAFLNDLDLIFDAQNWRLAGFYIRRFDIPFLTARAAVHGIRMPWWWPRPKDYTRVVDIPDLLGDGSLNDWCEAFGLEPKLDDNHGLDLPADELAAYCEGDVARTAFILRRMGVGR